MLLLVAMYFHSNQLSAIIELVCSTLGMKVGLSHQSVSNKVDSYLISETQSEFTYTNFVHRENQCRPMRL